MGRACRTYGSLGDNSRRKGPLSKPRYGWDDKIKINLKSGRMRCDSEHGQVACCHEQGNEILESIKCSEFLD